MSEEVRASSVPYEFQARVPFDHAVALVQVIRAGDPPPGEIMILAGAIAGEIGALRKSGFSFVQADAELEAIDAMTIEGALESIEQVCLAQDVADPNFNPVPYIPIILKILEWFFSRRG